MKGEEFKQKMLKLREQFTDILYEVEINNAYIFNQEDFEFFHTQVQKHIDRIDYSLGQYERGYTNEEYHNKTYSDFCIILKNDTEMWNKLKKIRFIAPRNSKDGIAKLSGQMLDLVSRVSNSNLLNIKSSLEEIYHISSDPSTVLSRTQIAEMKKSLNSYAKTIKTSEKTQSENDFEPIERE